LHYGHDIHSFIAVTMIDEGAGHMTVSLCRRKLVAGIGSLAGWPLVAHAQQAMRQQRIGVLVFNQTFVDCFLSGLHDLGWIEGTNIIVELRPTALLRGQVASAAAELTRAKPDLIVAATTPGAKALRDTTRDIPVVFAGVSDPVASGIVASLARPGANITGVSTSSPEMSGKLLEILKTVAPGTSRVGVFYNPDNEAKALEISGLQSAAQVLGVAIEGFKVHSSGDFDAAFKSVVQTRCDAIATLADAATLPNRSGIVDFAREKSLPAVYQLREFVESGGLVSYGVNYCEHYRRAAYYVDCILRGTKPADLPVELPTKFELVINLKTAKALGLTVPSTLLATADEIID
jgi:putative tryptophan/tyrosine transport system substrate-binding protein